MRLNSPSSTFTNTQILHGGACARPTARTAPARASASEMAKLIRGPTTAITNSAPGLLGSRSSWDTPPKMCRVMPATGIPYCRAAIA